MVKRFTMFFMLTLFSSIIFAADIIKTEREKRLESKQQQEKYLLEKRARKQGLKLLLSTIISLEKLYNFVYIKEDYSSEATIKVKLLENLEKRVITLEERGDLNHDPEKHEILKHKNRSERLKSLELRVVPLVKKQNFNNNCVLQ